MKGFSYVLELPTYMKMTNIFHADCLRKAKQPVPGQQLTPEPPDEVNGEPEWIVDRVLASRVSNKVLQYKVSWAGYDPDNQWYDANNFINAARRIKEYHDEYPDAAGPPTRLPLWLEAAQDERDLLPTDEDNVAVKTGPLTKMRRRKK